MKVSKIRIINILGIEDLQFDVGKGLTVIEGANSTGKTSVLSAISAALGGGHDASLLRHGAKEGEAVLILDDGTEVRKRITEERSSLSVAVDGLSAGQKYLNKLIKGEALDLVAFIDASPRDRVSMLRGALPEPGPEVLADVERMAARVATAIGRGAPDAIKDGALTAVEVMIEDLYDQRTVIGRVARDSRASHSEVKKTLPADHATRRTVAAVDAELAGLEAEASAEMAPLLREMEGVVEGSHADSVRVDQEERTDIAAARASLAVRQDEVSQEFAGQLSEIDEEVAALKTRLAELHGQRTAVERERAAKVSAVHETVRAEEEALRKVAAGARASLEVHYSSRKAELRGRIVAAEAALKGRRAALNSERDAAVSVAALRVQVERMDATAMKHEAAYEGLTGLLEELRAVATLILASIPVEGLSIQDGEVHLGGTPFPRLSGSEQVALAVEVARLGIGKLPLVLADRIESLDQERLDALRKRVEESGLQLVATRVSASGGPLRVVGC